MKDTASPLPVTLFAYGTLMRASGHPMARKLENQSRLIGPGWISGKLYSLGNFPGFVTSDGADDRVYGEVIRLTNPASSLAWMDEYEGCGETDPEPHPYERIIVPVMLRSGERLESWAYIYKLPVLNAELIPGGRFLRY